MKLNLLRTAVLFRRQSPQILSSLSPKRDLGPKRLKQLTTTPPHTTLAAAITSVWRLDPNVDINRVYIFPVKSDRKKNSQRYVSLSLPPLQTAPKSSGTAWLEFVQNTVCSSKRVMTCPLPPPPPSPPPDIPPSAAPLSRSRSPTRAGSIAPTSPRHIPQRSRMRASLSACRNTNRFEFDKRRQKKTGMGA